MGSMRRRGESFELKVYGGRDPITRKKIWHYRTIRGVSKRAAAKELAAFETEVDRGHVADGKVTLEELLRRYVGHRSPNWSPKTELETTGFIRRNIVPVVGHVVVAKIDAAFLDEYYRRLRESGGRLGRPLSAGTVRRIAGIVRAALEQAHRWGLIATNPATRCTPIPGSTFRANPPSDDEVRSLLAAASVVDPAFLTYVRLLAASGARRAEILGLRWDDVDGTTDSLIIRRTIVHGPAGVTSKDTKTGVDRRIALDRGTLDCLRIYRQAQTAAAELAGVELPGTAYVFSADPAGSRPWRPDSTTRRFRRLIRRAKVRPVRLHDLRHAMATKLIGGQIDVVTTAGRLGHANPATTLNVYAAHIPANDRDAARLIGDMLDGTDPPIEATGS